MSAHAPCPLCMEPLYGWVTVPAAHADASVGLPLAEGHGRTIDRCENCGVALERGAEVDLVAELEAVSEGEDDGTLRVECPNRASLQSAIGVEGWAALDRYAGGLALTPRALELLAERNGYHLGRPSFPGVGPNQAWMWQTLLNGLTFHPNFAREVRAGRLQPATARSRPTFAIDAVVTVLAAPLVALVSFPLELAASMARRGGLMRARLTRDAPAA